MSDNVDRYVILDCETTGLSPEEGDRIVSFAAVKITDDMESARAMHLVFNPARRSNPHALKVHGLSDRFLSHQRPFADFAQAIRDFIGDDIIVGHNISFDVSFLNAEFTLSGLSELPNRCICTMEMARCLGYDRVSLDDLASSLGFDVSVRSRKHDAFIDVSLTYQVFQIIYQKRSTPYSLEYVDYSNAVDFPVSSIVKRLVDVAGRETHALSGRSFAVTGEVSIADREELEAFFPAIGAIYHPRVRKDTDYLIVGTTPGKTKLALAEARLARYGRPSSLTEADFQLMLENLLINITKEQ